MALQDTRWWLIETPDGADKRDLAAAVMSRAQHLQHVNSSRQGKNAQWVSNYENRELSSIPADGVNLPPSIEPGDITFNVTQSCVDAVDSKISSNEPKPQYLTVDGDFSQQQKAKARQRFTMGALLDGGAYPSASDAITDCLIQDGGCVKVVVDEDADPPRMVYERVDPNEVLVDEKAAQNGKPREMMQRKVCATDVVAAVYSEHADEIIRSANNAPGGSGGGRDYAVIEDQVVVVEAWHLPSSRKAKDGRHVIATQYAVLVDDEWKDDNFPIRFVRWTKLRRGFWGQGLGEQLSGIQDSVTNHVRDIERSHKFIGRPLVTIPGGCTIKSEAFTNDVADVYEHDGPPPTITVHGVMPPESYSWLETKYQKAFEISGISQLSATSRKPAGVESGVALRTLLDTETVRFAKFVKGYQRFILELAEETIRAARRSGKNVIAHWRCKEWARAIPWDAIKDDPDDRFVLQLWPVAMMPDTPTGKMAYAEQMLTTGMFKPEEVRQLLPFPDIEAIDRTGTAARELVEMAIEHMLDTGEIIAPTKHWNLALALDLGQSSLLRGQINGWPADRQALISDWLDQVAALRKQVQMEEIAEQQAMQPPPSTPSGPPPGGMQAPQENPAALAA